MNATNTLSIKSPIVWQANLQPSKIFAVLYWAILTLALIALWQCPVHWGTRMALMLVTAIGGFIIFLPTRQSASLAFCEDNSWLFVENSQPCIGQLSSGTYRSMLLIVVAIKPTRGSLRYAIVWRDSVTATDYSALHVRLALISAHQLY